MLHKITTSGEIHNRQQGRQQRRKAGPSDGRKLLPKAAKQQVLDWVKKQPGGKWRDSQRALLTASKDSKTGIGWAPSPATLSRYLKGTRLIEKSTYTSHIARRHRRGGTEAIARNDEVVKQTDAYIMPNDPDGN